MEEQCFLSDIYNKSAPSLFVFICYKQIIRRHTEQRQNQQQQENVNKSQAPRLIG